MNERQMQFRVGVVVFATMIIGGLLASLNGPLPTGWLPWGHAQYQVGIVVPQAPGVDSNTPVRKNGILIGRVKSIEDKDGGVLLKADIDGNRPLYADYEPHIRTTVLGDATIDFLPRRPQTGAQPVPDGTVFQGRVDPNPFDSLAQLGDLKEEFGAASRSLAHAGDEVTRLASRVNEAFGDEGPGSEGRVKRLIDSTERAMNQFAMTMESVNEIIGDEPIAAMTSGAAPPQSFNARRPADLVTPPNSTAPNAAPFNAAPLNTTPPANNPVPGTTPGAVPTEGQQMRQRLRQGLDELPDAIHEFRATMKDSRVVLQSAERNFKNLETFTEPLGQKGPEISEAILRTVAGLDQVLHDFGDVAKALNNRQGTVGRLIHEDQLYENANRLMFNANKVLADIDQLTLNLKPVIADARVLMDKIATEPGRIISGAIKPSVVK
jgi:phospholipid/cholesterol/gamma-HCH transport system substrate-binding protein